MSTPQIAEYGNFAMCQAVEQNKLLYKVVKYSGRKTKDEELRAKEGHTNTAEECQL